MTTELEVQPPRTTTVSLYNGGVSIEDIASVAGQFADVVKQQRLFKRIGDRNHILIEAWQTIATLTGVAAVEDGGVKELPWPDVADPGPEPDVAGPEPRGSRETEQWLHWKAADERYRNWAHGVTVLEARALGKAWGFSAAYRAERDGQELGSGEGRVNRSERTWAGRDDYALASMAQTRGQSRALGAALRFIVSMAGYEPSLPDDGAQMASESVTEASPSLETTDDDAQLARAADAVKRATGLDGEAFVAALGQKFDGVPLVAITTLRGVAKFVEDDRQAKAAAANDEEIQ